MIPQHIGLGGRRDPRSRKDWYKTIPPDVEIPEAASVTCRQPVLDQGKVGSCFGFAVAVTIAQWFASRGVDIGPISAMFAYYYGRVDWGVPPGEDSGTNPRAGLDALAKRGICPESLWPNSEFFSSEPSELARKVALLNKLPVRYACDSLRDIRHSIGVENLAVLVGLPIYEPVFYTGSDGRFQLPDPWKDTPDGWHEMSAVAYDKGGIWCQTSWGKFGKDGCIYFPDEYWNYDGFDGWKTDLAPPSVQ